MKHVKKVYVVNFSVAYLSWWNVMGLSGGPCQTEQQECSVPGSRHDWAVSTVSAGEECFWQGSIGPPARRLSLLAAILRWNSNPGAIKIRGADL